MLVNQLCLMHLQILVKAQAENFPFCTIDPNLGVVPVIDERLDKLSNISNSKKNLYNYFIC